LRAAAEADGLGEGAAFERARSIQADLMGAIIALVDVVGRSN
jgi:hypothetical protein